MLPSIDSLLLAAASLPRSPAAIEAMWDGDSTGWFVKLLAVVETETGYRAQFLAKLQGGHSNSAGGERTLWIAAQQAQEVGSQLALRLGVPFYFPSPRHPEDECPHWWEQKDAHLCRRCGIFLLQDQSCPWRGVCYCCHLDEKKEKRMAAFTLEERSGPQCQICGNPAKDTLDFKPICPVCLERYTVFQCSCCGRRVLTLKSLSDTVCSTCQFNDRFVRLDPGIRCSLETAVKEQGPMPAIVLALKLLPEWEFYDSVALVHRLNEPDGGRN